jgi:hypothetical protein
MATAATAAWVRFSTTKLAEGAGQVGLDGLLREEELPGDLPVGGPFSQEAEDVHLPPRSPISTTAKPTITYETSLFGS